jgi:outer membrane protein assembly factor BamB
MRCRFLLLASLLAAPAALSAADWPQWRGPNRDGVSGDKNLLDKWPKDGPKLLWKKTELTNIGAGYGSPAVVGGKMYLIGADGAKQDAKEFVTCLNVKDGSQVWQTKLTTSAGKFLDGWGGGPRATPTVDGGFVYALGATGDLVCLTADKGEVKWTKNLVSDFGGGIPQWGYSESVLIDGDALLCTPGGKGGMIALNKATGETVWQCKDLADAAGYSSIIVTEVGGVKQYVTQTMASGVGVRAKDGKLLWKVGKIGRKIAVIPTPVVADGYVFFTAGYGAGCECFKLEKDGDGTKATQVYSNNKTLQNHHGGVVRVGDFVYGHSDVGGWMCFPFKSGGDEPAWKNSGVGKGACSLADGHLYCVSEKTGTVALVKPNEKAYQEVSRFAIPAQSELRKKQPQAGMTGVWAHPVIADGKLFVRDFDLLYVYDVAKPNS